MIFVWTAADPVAAFGVPGTSALAASVEAQHQRPVREVLTDSKCVDRADGFDPKSSSAALVGKRAVDEAVCQNPAAGIQCGANGLGNMIGPGGREQQGFRFRTPTVFRATEEQLADALSPFASTGLSSDEDIQSAVAQD